MRRDPLRCIAALALGLLLFASAAHGQGQRTPQVSAILGDGIVRLGGSTQLMVEVQDATVAKILALPQVEGLRLGPVQGPVESEYIKIMGGRSYRRSTLKWVVGVTPEREGEWTIPPLRLEVEGREMLTDEITVKAVRDTKGEELGFIELVNPPTRIYEGQPFTLDLRFGWDRGLSVNTAGLRLPWWGQMPGTLQVEEADGRQRDERIELVVNRRYKVRAAELDPLERAGREFVQLRLARRYLAARPGPLELPSGSFEFARLASRGGFGEPDRYEEFFALLPEHTIEVLPVPEAGRPFEWTGAVGSIAATRRVDRRDVDAGESIKLTVAWSGDGNLEFFDLPDPSRLDSFTGFRLLGIEDDYGAGVRQATYDLVPVSAEVNEIPAIPLWSFDPELERYREVRTEPVPIRVRRLEGTGLAAEEDAPREAFDIRDIRTTAAAGADTLPRPGAGTVGAAFALALLGWGFGRTAVRRRGRPDAPLERRRRGARRVLARQLSRATRASEQQRALHDYLAARSREPREAWVGRELDDSAHAAGVEVGALAALAEVLRRLDAEVYGGPDQPLERGEVLRVADDLRGEGL